MSVKINYTIVGLQLKFSKLNVTYLQSADKILLHIYFLHTRPTKRHNRKIISF